MKKPDVTLPSLQRWLVSFHQYIDSQKRALDLYGDWPALMGLYSDTRAMYETIRANDPAELPHVVVDVTTGEHILTINGVEVQHDFTLLGVEQAAVDIDK